MDYRALLDCLSAKGMGDWSRSLATQLEDYFSHIKHGDYPRWQQALDTLPECAPSQVELNADAVTIGRAGDCDETQAAALLASLQQLIPWRKGPFSLFGIDIDSEWRSCLKWDRLQRHIQPLADRLVLDIGSGNGYYAWRMLGEGARYVVGVDPTLLFLMQFQAVKTYQPNAAIDLLPFGIQQLPTTGLAFDTVFSMGVIYHRRDPLEHLQHLKSTLKPNGELVLETLVLDEETDRVLLPADRYAKMNNVHAVPSLTRLTDWLTEAGFVNARVVDVAVTTVQEQRRTAWMRFESLADFLDKKDSSKTIEGYPAPVRAILVANRPA